MDPILSLQQQLEQEIDKLELPQGPTDLYDPIKYTLSNGGKRMRPLLLLMGCKVFNEDVSDAIGPAMAIELFHNFSLLHDDIMDQAPIRRGKPSVHAKWNANVAILSGDAMMIKAYQQLARTRAEAIPAVLSEFSTAALQVCEGQQMDMDFEKRQDVSIGDYLRMIELKTAVLLAASLKIGALIGGADTQQAQLMYAFGLESGIAFQLQDDILDVFGESKKVGKQKGGDIIANKKTFLLLKALERATGNTRSQLEQWFAEDRPDHEKVAAVTAIYNELNVRELAEAEMQAHFDRGADSLAKVAGNQAWKSTLARFATRLMHREH